MVFSKNFVWGMYLEVILVTLRVIITTVAKKMSD